MTGRLWLCVLVGSLCWCLFMWLVCLEFSVCVLVAGQLAVSVHWGRIGGCFWWAVGDSGAVASVGVALALRKHVLVRVLLAVVASVWANALGFRLVSANLRACVSGLLQWVFFGAAVWLLLCMGWLLWSWLVALCSAPLVVWCSAGAAGWGWVLGVCVSVRVLPGAWRLGLVCLGPVVACCSGSVVRWRVS